MRKLIISNFQTLDGYYEAKNKTFDRFFDYFYEGYGNDEAFDVYNRDLLRAAIPDPERAHVVFGQQKLLDGCAQRS